MNKELLLKRWREFNELPPPTTPEEAVQRGEAAQELLKQIEEAEREEGRQDPLDEAEIRETSERQSRIGRIKAQAWRAGLDLKQWWGN